MRVPLAFAASLVAGTAVAAEEPSAQSLNPFEITRGAAEFVAGLESFSFRWLISHDEIVDGRDKPTHFQSGTTTVVRDLGFVARIESDGTYRDFYFDGEALIVSSPNENSYATTPFKGSFETLVETVTERMDAVLPMWSIMSRDLPERLAQGAGSMAYLGVKLIDGQLAHHLAFAAQAEDWQVWISNDPDAPVPIMMIATDIGVQGGPKSRIHLADWRFRVDPDPTQFIFVPDADDVLLAVPELSPAVGLLERGTTDAAAAQAPGSGASKRLLRFLAIVSIISGPEPLATFLAPH